MAGRWLLMMTSASAPLPSNGSVRLFRTLSLPTEFLTAAARSIDS